MKFDFSIPNIKIPVPQFPRSWNFPFDDHPLTPKEIEGTYIRNFGNEKINQ